MVISTSEGGQVMEIKAGQSFAEALEREVSKTPSWRYVVCVECETRKRIAKGNVCARCKGILAGKKRRQ